LEDLDLYEKTFARRIAWKWDAVLGELELRKWAPSVSRVVDFGCGSGVAGRKVLDQWSGQVREVVLLDRSPMARSYAAKLLPAAGVDVRDGGAEFSSEIAADSVVLASHVVTELSPAQLSKWTDCVAGASAVIWVEAATHDASRRLVECVREPLLRAGWSMVAPCTHSSGCPMLTAQNERHWCHHFARVPSVAHQDPAWKELSSAVGVDLRVLPYSFLVMERRVGAQRGGTAGSAGGFCRVIGAPRQFKGHLKVLRCGEEGLEEVVLQKRDAPVAFKNLSRGDGVPVYGFKEEAGKVLEAKRFGQSGEV
jgi:ribosomal protein RSM22 (predicted rRNA methylase)